MLQICNITFIEGIRSRILFSIFVFSLIIMFLSTIFSQFFLQDIGKVIVDFNLSAISLAGLLISFSVSVSLIAKDLDKRTIYFVLGRGISRQSYICGKFVGIVLIIIVSYALIFLTTLIPIYVMKSQIPFYFKSFDLGLYVMAVFADLAKCILLNALIIFFSTFVSTSFSTLIFSILIYICGQSLSEVTGYVISSETESVLSGILTVLNYIVPNFALLDFKALAANGIAIPFSVYLCSISYAIVYSIILLVLAGLIFRNKEFL